MPQEIYYLILAGCFLAIFISLRLKDSRMGRAWKAMREDEDVAQAMASTWWLQVARLRQGAGFSALSGAIFGDQIDFRLSSQHERDDLHQYRLCHHCWGHGKHSGVIVGAAALVGLPNS